MVVWGESLGVVRGLGGSLGVVWGVIRGLLSRLFGRLFWFVKGVFRGLTILSKKCSALTIRLGRRPTDYIWLGLRHTKYIGPQAHNL